MINQDLHRVSWWSPWWWAIIGLGPQRPNPRVSALFGVFPSWIGGKDWQEVDMILYCGGSGLRIPLPAALQQALVSSSRICVQPCVITRIAHGELGQYSSVLIPSLWLGLITHITTLRLFLWVLILSSSLLFFHLFSFLFYIFYLAPFLYNF